MSVRDVGYRFWEGKKTLPWMRPVAIARSGISLVLQNKWLRLLILGGWLPILVPAAVVFVFEYASTQNPDEISGFLAAPPIARPDLAVLYASDPEAVRHEIWTSAILTFFRYPQLFAMVILVGLITPRLVSYDLRSRAYLQYFARPLSPMEYVLGKSAVIWFFLTAIVTVPALFLYLGAVMLSPNLSVVQTTWDIPLRILGASVALLVPTTTLAMVYSTLTSESRFATFAWFATWAMGFVAYNFLTFAPGLGGAPPPPGRFARRRNLEAIEEFADLDKWRLISPYHTLGKVQGWVFDLNDTDGSVWPALLMLLAITVAGTWLIRSRLLARLRI